MAEALAGRAPIGGGAIRLKEHGHLGLRVQPEYHDAVDLRTLEQPPLVVSGRRPDRVQFGSGRVRRYLPERRQRSRLRRTLGPRHKGIDGLEPGWAVSAL